MPDPQVPLYSLGAPLREVYPIVPLAAEHGVGVSIISYDERVTFAVMADSESTPDSAALAAGIEQGLEEPSTYARAPYNSTPSNK